jgi:hypothetical protein
MCTTMDEWKVCTGAAPEHEGLILTAATFFHIPNIIPASQPSLVHPEDESSPSTGWI